MYLHSYIATDLGFNSNLELRTLVLSIKSVLVCAAGLTALDTKKRQVRVPCWATPQNLNVTFNRKSKARVRTAYRATEMLVSAN